MCYLSSVGGKVENSIVCGLKLRQRICQSALIRNAKGFTLIEVLIAVVILSLVGVSVPAAMVMVAEADFKWNEKIIAETITRNQMEYVKSAPYDDGGGTYPEYGEVPVPDDTYEIEVVARPIHIVPGTREHLELPEGEDEGIQEITVRIHHVDRIVLETKNYKVDR
jgi:prepilin-type N-terminal cleavage/methylation domain-containing protein